MIYFYKSNKLFTAHV